MLRFAAIGFCSLMLVGCQTTQFSTNQTALSGKTIRTVAFHNLNADCSNIGPTVVRLTRAPANGQVKIVQEASYPTYQRENQRFDCNRRRAPGTSVYFQSSAGFVGDDSFDVEVIFASGGYQTYTHRLSVR